ncbi:MAG: transposase, partial [Bacillota bacterium]|nr:transposase [Bacillota bacterium]
PYLGWIRIKEKGYIPTDSESRIISGWIKKCAGRYYISALVKREEKPRLDGSVSLADDSVNANIGTNTMMDAAVGTKVFKKTDGIGIDLNVSNFATLSNGMVFDNVNKSKHMVHLMKSLHREKRSLGRKYQNYKDAIAIHSSQDDIANHNCNRNDNATHKNYFKQLAKVDKIYNRMNCIRIDYLRKCIEKIIKMKPKFVAVEDLSITDMVKDNRFGKYITDEHFYQFKMGLYRKCKENGIEFRVVNKWYPSTRKCHDCGYVGSKISVQERSFVCPQCGSVMPRDLNASLNIRDAKDYVVWKS